MKISRQLDSYTANSIEIQKYHTIYYFINSDFAVRNPRRDLYKINFIEYRSYE